MSRPRHETLKFQNQGKPQKTKKNGKTLKTCRDRKKTHTWTVKWNGNKGWGAQKTRPSTTMVKY